MKQFIVDRHTTPATPTLEQVPTEKIPVYVSRAAAESDLANLAAGQIICTPDTGDELAQPVNVVEEDNLHAVSSYAVYNMFQLSTVTIASVSAAGQAGGNSLSAIIPKGKYLCMCNATSSDPKATNFAFSLTADNAVASSEGNVNPYQGGSLGGGSGQAVMYFESNGTTTKVKAAIFNYGSGSAITYSFTCYLLKLA